LVADKTKAFTRNLLTASLSIINLGRKYEAPTGRSTMLTPELLVDSSIFDQTPLWTTFDVRAKKDPKTYSLSRRLYQYTESL